MHAVARLVLAIVLAIVLVTPTAAGLWGEETVGEVTITGIDRAIVAGLRYEPVCKQGDAYEAGYERLDAGGLARALQDAGYLDATAQATTSVVDHVHAIVVHATSGPLFRIQDLVIAGADPEVRRTLLDLAQVKPGDPATRAHEDLLRKQAIDLLGAKWQLTRVFKRSQPLVTYVIQPEAPPPSRSVPAPTSR